MKKSSTPKGFLAKSSSSSFYSHIIGLFLLSLFAPSVDSMIASAPPPPPAVTVAESSGTMNNDGNACSGASFLFQASGLDPVRIQWRLGSTTGTLLQNGGTTFSLNSGNTGYPSPGNSSTIVAMTPFVPAVPGMPPTPAIPQASASEKVAVYPNSPNIPGTFNTSYCSGDPIVNLLTLPILSAYNTDDPMLDDPVFSGPGIVPGTSNFNPANAIIGGNNINVTFPCPDPNGLLSSFNISVYKTPVSIINDYKDECLSPGPGEYNLQNLFGAETNIGGTFSIVSQPAGGTAAIDANNANVMDFNRFGCYEIEYLADNPQGCIIPPTSDRAFLLITERPEPNFEFASGTDVGCSTTAITATVTRLSPTYVSPVTYNWTIVSGSGSIANPTSASPTITVNPAAPYSTNSVVVQLEETIAAPSACNGLVAADCVNTVRKTISIYNDGVDCNSSCHDGAFNLSVCEVDVEPAFSFKCTTLGIDLKLFDFVDAKIKSDDAGPDRSLGCNDTQVSITYDAGFAGILGQVQNATAGGKLIRQLPGFNVICGISDFSIFGWEPFSWLDPHDDCDRTIGGFIIAVLGRTLGGDGGGYQVWADTDGDAQFDTLIKEYEFGDGDMNVLDITSSIPNYVRGQGKVTARVITSFPQSPNNKCGQIQPDGRGLLDLLPIGSIPVVGPPIEDALNAAGCDIELAWDDADTRSWKVFNSEPPVFVNCPDATDLTFSDEYSCNTPASWSIPVAIDGCDGTALPFISDPLNTDPGIRQTAGPSPGTSLPIGTHVVTYTATGCNTLTETCTFNIIISPGAPQLVCPGSITIGTDQDQCTAVVPGLTPLSGIGCNTTITYTTTGVTTLASPLTGINDISGATFNLGTTVVTYRMSYDHDGDANTPELFETCTFEVIVEDNELPTVACMDIDVQLDNTGAYTVMAADIDGGSTDNCGIASILISGNGQLAGPSIDFDCGDVGPNTVTLTVIDNANNRRRCLAIVNVISFFEDYQLALDIPELCLEANNPSQLNFSNYLTITSPNGTNIPFNSVGALGPNVVGGFGITAYAPTLGGSVLGTSPANPGDIGYIDPDTGIYTPGTGSGFMTVSYVISIGQQIAQNGQIINECYKIVHDIFELRQPLTMDDPECVCGNLEERIVDLGVLSGGLEPYTIQYSGAKLYVGNATVPDSNGTYIYETAFGHDITDAQEDLGRLSVEYTQPTWSFTVVDSRGCELFRSGSCDNDDLNVGPMIPCQANPPVLNTEPLLCESHYAWLHPLPTDNCSVILYSYQINNPDGSIDGPHNLNALLNIAPGAPIPALFEAEYEFELGVSTVLYYAEDAVGNFITCSFEVTVIDDDPPYFINCPYPPVIENAETGFCDAYVNFALPLAEDNCDVPVVTQIDNTGLAVGDRFPVGTTVLYYQAEDLAGNKDTCQVKVIVNDLSVPTIVCPDNVTQGTDDWLCSAVVNDIAAVVDSDCPDNLAVTYSIFSDAALTQRIDCGVWDASGNVFEKGTSWVKYRVQNQPLLLITEVNQSGATDQIEITNLGPASININCLSIARSTSNAFFDETFADVSQLPALSPTIMGVGDVMVFDFTEDAASTLDACYTMSFMGVTLDEVAVNGFAGCSVFTGALASGDVYRICEDDSNDAADWTSPEYCFPANIGLVNPDLDIMPDNGTTSGLQSILPKTATCTFTVTIQDDEDPFCGELAPNVNSFTGGALAGIGTVACSRSILNISQDCIIGLLSFDLTGTVTTANSTIKLISPAGTEVDITSLPADPHGFYLEKSKGDWILEIEANPGAGPLSVSSWSMDITCMDPFVMPNVVLNNDPTLCGASFTWNHPYFIDNCFVGVMDVAYTTTDAACVPFSRVLGNDPNGILPGIGGFEATEFFCVGTTTVTYTLVDDAGRQHQCAFDVTVLDVEAPVVDCPQDIFITLNGGECRRSVCFEPVFAGDNCAVVDTIMNPPSCSFFEIGTTTVSIIVLDAAGNSDTCYFDVNIIEHVPISATMACNDLVQISLDEDCSSEITADMLLEGDDYHCYEDYIISVTQYGSQIVGSPFVTGQHIGQTLLVYILDPDTGNECWVEVLVEAKAIDIECPADTTVYCNQFIDPAHLGRPKLLTCIPNATYHYVDAVQNNGNCDNIKSVITRTWTIADAAGNSKTCDQIITIKKGTLSDIVFPKDVTWTCRQEMKYANIIDPTYLHSCIFDGDLTDGDIDVTLNPDVDDDFDNPLNDPDFNTLGNPTAETDDYDGGANPLRCNIQGLFDPITGLFGGAFDSRTNSYGYPVNGPLTQNSAAGQLIRGLEDADVLELTGSGIPLLAGLGLFNTGHCQFSYNYEDDLYFTCSGSKEILRTWKVRDMCLPVSANNPRIHVQVIKVNDTDGPELVCFDDYSITANLFANSGHDICFASHTFEPIQFTDQCSDADSIEVEIVTPFGTIIGNGGYLEGLEIGVHPITYIVKDDCGNISTCTFNLSVVDDLPPIPVCREFTQVALNTDQTVKVPAVDFDEGSYDGCFPVYFKVRRMDSACDGHGTDQTLFNDEIHFCCEDTGKDSVIVILRVYDVDPGPGSVSVNHLINNSNDCMIEVLVEDKNKPTCIAPADEWKDCRDIPANVDLTDTAQLSSIFGRAIAEDNCGAYIEELQPDVDVDLCGVGAITRRFRAFDAFGNASIGLCRQTIMIMPFNDYTINVPDDYYGECGPANADALTVENAGCDLMAISIEDDSLFSEPGSCFKIFRTYNIINWCEYDGFSAATELPRRDRAPLNAFGDAYSAWSNGDWVYWDGTVDPVDRQLASSGFYTYTQHIKVYDDTAPALSNPVTDVFCGGELDEDPCTGLVEIEPGIIEDCTDTETEYALDINNDGTYEVSRTAGTLSRRIELGSHRVHFWVSDKCGNTSEIDIEFDVEDCKEPTPVCINGLSVDLMATGMVEIWAKDWNASSYDYCTPENELKFRVNRIVDQNGDGIIDDQDHQTTVPAQDSAVFRCKDLGYTYVQMWVGDNAGNWDYCVTFVEVQDHLGACAGTKTIHGNITDILDKNVADVTVELSGNMSNSVITSDNGNYQFAVPAASDVTVTPSKDLDPRNGVSTFDLVLISKHILNVEKLNNPYKMIAADANNSGSVSTLDLVSLRKLVLRLSNELPNNTSWRFVDRTWSFADANNPWSTPFPEVVNFNNVSLNDLEANFVAIKVGDINGNAKANSLTSVDNRSFNGSLVFHTANQSVQAGEEFTVELRANENVQGYQFTLNLNSKIADLVDIKEGIANEGNFNVISEGSITTSWNGEEMVKGAEMFALVLRAKTDLEVSEVLSISSEYTVAEAYGLTGELMDIAFDFNNGILVKAGFELYQNNPNPFSQETVIGFNLPEASPATLTFSDVSGKVIRVIKGDYAAGYNAVTLKDFKLTTSGVFWYELKTDGFKAVKKMVILE